MFHNKQSSQPNQTQVNRQVHGNMGAAPCTWPGVQNGNYQTPPNGYHPVQPPHVEANGWPIHPESRPNQHAFANRVIITPGTNFKNGNVRMAPIPHPAGPNHRQMHMQAHRRLQNNNAYVQSFQPMNPGSRAQQPASNGNVQHMNPRFRSQQPSSNGNVQHMNPGSRAQQPAVNSNVQHMNSGFRAQQPASNGNVQHVNPGSRAQQPVVNSNVQPMNPGSRAQQPAYTGNGPVSNNNNGNGNGSSPNRQMSGTHRNEAFNVPSQNGQSNMMMAHQNGVSHSPDGMTGVPPQMQGTHHNEFFSASNHIGQNNNMIAHQNGVTQPPHEVNPGTSPQNQGPQQSSPFHEPNHPGQNNNAVAHHEMNPRAPSYIPGTHYNEPFHEPTHPGNGNIIAPQNGATQPFPRVNPEHLPPHSSQPHQSAPHHAVQDGLNIPAHSDFNGVQQTNVGHPNPNSDAENMGIESHPSGSWDPNPHMGQNPPAPDHGSGLSPSQAQIIYTGEMVLAPHQESEYVHQYNVHHLNQGVPPGSFGGNQTGAVTTQPHIPPQPDQQDAPAPDPDFVNPSIPGYQPDVHAWLNNSHAPASVAQAPDRSSDSGTVPHPNPSNAGFTMSPTSNEMGADAQAENAMVQSTPPNANPPFPQDGQFHHPFNGGTQPANDQNVENMGNPDVFQSGSQGFPNGMAQHPVPVPQPVNSNAGQHMNQNNHGFQNDMVQHPAPEPQPVNSNAGQHMNQNNHSFQNGTVHHPVPVPQPSDSNAGQCMNQNNHGFQNGMVHHPVPAPQPSVSNAAQHMNPNNHSSQNGMVHHPVPAPQPSDSNAVQHMNQNNHGSQNGMVHHPVPAPQPSDSNAVQHMNQNNHGSQNGMVHHPVPAPQPSDPNAVQHMNQNNHGFQDGVTHDPAPGAQPNGNSHAAHAERRYIGQYVNIEKEIDSALHQMAAGEAVGQYPALYPVPTVAQNQQVHAQRFEPHPAQYHDLGSLQSSNVQIVRGVGAHPHPSMTKFPIPGPNFPIDPCVKLWRKRLNRRANSKKGVRKREQPGKPRGGRRSIGTTSNQPPLHSQSNGEGGLAPIPPGISPPTPGHGSQGGGAPPVQPISQLNGHRIVPTSAETSAGVPPAQQENGYSVPYANDNRENRDPTELQSGNGGVPPDPAVFQELANPTPGQTINGVHPSVPVLSANGVGTAPNMNGNPDNAVFGGLLDIPKINDKEFHAMFLANYNPDLIDLMGLMGHDNTPGDLRQIPASTGSSSVQPNEGQLTANDFDASMQTMAPFGHENTPGYPAQVPSLAGSSSAQPNIHQPGQEEMEVFQENTPAGPAQIPSSTGSSLTHPNAGQLTANDFYESMQTMAPIGHENTPGYPAQVPSLAGSSSAQPNVDQPGQEEMEVCQENTPAGPAQIPSSTGSSLTQPNAGQFRPEDFEETMANM
ncbi:hypothetical protein EMPG_10917 [Blastomyces silverae]|uniref:Uncharacterized protein n=1 Tax=Blastomyces silverae TaxID=2060906 RepID=A0A0H1B2C4_9EURO|nr:hypothetical protein EMPG_10917 [Blastomyces silverae]